MEVIVLAGGFGTRLRHVVSDVPKPMAPVCNRPFLEYIVKYLKKYHVTKIIFAIGYKGDQIRSFFKCHFDGIIIDYSNEDTPLLTGGAIKKALSKCIEQNVVVMNGDTFFNVDLGEMLAFHHQVNSDITIATKKMSASSRYGSVTLKENRIIRFEEKQYRDQLLINGGIYIMRRNILENFEKEKFSFELDFLKKELHTLNIMSYQSDGYFVDIGIPEDYHQANIDFKNEVIYE